MCVSVAVLAITTSAWANLGQTRAEIEKQYGTSIQCPPFRSQPGTEDLCYHRPKFPTDTIQVTFFDGISQREHYRRYTTSKLDVENENAVISENEFQAILRANSAGHTWNQVNVLGGEYWFLGARDMHRAPALALRGDDRHFPVTVQTYAMGVLMGLIKEDAHTPKPTEMLFSAAALRSPSPTPDASAADKARREREDAAVEAIIREREREREKYGYIPKWTYSEQEDEMGRGTGYWANVESSNTVDFDFPYQGSQHATLTLRSLPKDGHKVYISVERGQFLTGSYGLERAVAVKFDEGKIQSFDTAGSSAGKTTIMFIEGYDRFVRQLRQAKTVSIEAEFFQEGRRAFHFDVGGLSWKH